MSKIANLYALFICLIFISLIYLFFSFKLVYAALSLGYVRENGTSGTCIINNPSTQCNPPADSCTSNPSTPMTCTGYDSIITIDACSATASCGPTDYLSCGTQASGRGGIDNSNQCTNAGFNVVSCTDSSLCSVDLSGIGCLSCSGTGSVCGDDDCESSLGEDCGNCNEDCGSCLSPSPSQSSSPSPSPSPTIGNCSVSVTDGSVTETEASVTVTNPSGCNSSSSTSWSISGGIITSSGSTGANITNLTSNRNYTVSATRCGVSCSTSFTTPTPGECAVDINSITSNSASASVSGPPNCATSASWSANPAATISNGSLSNLAAETQYIVTARRCNVSCSKSFITSAGGSWSGSCKGGTTYHVSGPPNTMTCAIRSGDSFPPPNNSFFWQGYSTGSAGQVDIPITASQNFTWYSGDCRGNGSGATQQGTGYCNSDDNPPPYDPGTVGIRGSFSYPDGTPYDGFGLNGQGIPVYFHGVDSENDDYNQCTFSGNADYVTTLDGTVPGETRQYLFSLDKPTCTRDRVITKKGYSFIDTHDYGCGCMATHCGDITAFYRFLWPQFPASFSVIRTWGGDGYPLYSCNAWGGSTGAWLYDVQYPNINSKSAFKFGWPTSLLGAGQYPTINFTVRPPVSLTVNKTGSGTVTGVPNNGETITKTREGWNGSADPQTLTASCNPGSTITSYSSTYGDGANGSSLRGGCGNGITACGTCTKGATSCTNTYTNAICGRNDNYWCADAKLTVNCAPPSITLTSATTSQVYYKTSSDASQNTNITLTAIPSDPYQFAGWTGDCSGSACTVVMDNNRTVTANFILPPRILTVKKKGSGAGGVKAIDRNGAGIEKCEAYGGCSQSFPHGTAVTISPNYNNSNAIFRGWSESTDNECSGTNLCQIIMDKGKSITGTFDPPVCSYLKTVGGDVYSGTGINMSCSQ